MSEPGKAGDKAAAPQSAAFEDDEFTRLRTEQQIPDDADMPTDRNPADPRPLSQIIAEAGAVREAPDPALRATETESADAYLADGVWGAPGSEVAGSAQHKAGGVPGEAKVSRAEDKDAGKK